MVLGCLSGPAGATVYELPDNGSAVFGTDERIKSTYQDTLLDIARRYSLGYEEIIRANPGVDMWLPGEGTDILLPGKRILPPGPREGVVVNLPEHRLYYFPKTKKGEKPVVITYPVSIGKMDWSTPLGETRVVSKQKHPSWYPPESVRKEHLANGDPLPKVVPAGPDNPLGDYAMRLAVGGGSYMLHGTNNPMAVGMAITHGCIRMYPEDVAALFPLVPVGTKVWLINDPVKVAYVDGELLLEAHPPVDSEGQTTEPNLELLSQQLDKAVGNDTAAIHWDLARDTLQAANGIPAVVGLQADVDAPPAPGGTEPPANAPQGQGGSAAPPPGIAATPGAPGSSGPSSASGSAAAAPAPTREPPTKVLAPVYAPGTAPAVPAATTAPSATAPGSPPPPASVASAPTVPKGH
ncbi:MAG: L,D-transpeptidase ErfK/SrfK [Gammaproteobacteria bacterium]|nr:L,D-transpeptidase ErfK/SrfK [Gammaproteobacteria bacterium]